MRIKWMINSLIIVLFCSAALFGLARRDSAAAAGDGSEKIETTLLDQISTDGSADFIVRFTEQPDLSAAYSMDWDARGEFVYNTLRDSAKRSQANAKATLDAQGLTYQTLIAGNELYVWGGSQATTFRVSRLAELTALNALAALPEVSTIRATRTYTIDPITHVKPFENVTWAGDLLAEHALTTVGDSTNTATLDWGITDTKANQFWTTFGVAGDGIVVASIDTGVQWNHPALDQAFKCGTNPSDPKCWADPSNICGGSACDNNGHGTHTMGTMVGDDDPWLQYNVGMAPNAKWIACKGCETSTCSEFALTTCADWILAPGGDSANRPNIVNNSWGDVGGNAWYMTYVNNWRAAGIFPAFSAGNSGLQGCSSLGSPGDYQESFASAAHDNSRNIASFSSRGPSAQFGDTPYTKPNISAPGVGIWSAYPTTKSPSTWALMSGTSMASPHTAGAVALLWSCNPALKGQIDATFKALQNNADATPAGTCGAPANGQGNYTYGYGYLDVLSAGSVTCNGPIGTLNGHVYDKDANPIGGAILTATSDGTGNHIQGFTNPSGLYTINLLAGKYTVSAMKGGYSFQSNPEIVVTQGITTTLNFTLTLAKPFFLPVIFRNLPNQNPTDILLSNSNIMESQPTNTLVGNLSTTDPDSGNTFSYNLVSGSGDSNNGSFNISGNQLRTSEVFDYETKNSYSIRIRTTDQEGLSFEKIFIITITPFSANPIGNGDFEQGRGVAWTEYSKRGYELILQPPNLIVKPYDGTWAVWLGGVNNEISYIQQQIIIPAANPYLSYWHWIASADGCNHDVGGLLVNGTAVDTYWLCIVNNTYGWVQKVVNLSAYAGQSVSIQIRAECNGIFNSNLFIDHVSFQSTPMSENYPPESNPFVDASISKVEILGK